MCIRDRGDSVMVLKKPRAPKLEPRWSGPFQVSSVSASERTMVVQEPTEPRARMLVHVDRAKLAPQGQPEEPGWAAYRAFAEAYKTKPLEKDEWSVITAEESDFLSGGSESALEKGEYEVEYVLDERDQTVVRNNTKVVRHQFLVKWAGYDKSHNQWVDEEWMEADQAIADFRRTRDQQRADAPPVTTRAGRTVKKTARAIPTHAEGGTEEPGVGSCARDSNI